LRAYSLEIQKEPPRFGWTITRNFTSPQGLLLNTSRTGSKCDAFVLFSPELFCLPRNEEVLSRIFILFIGVFPTCCHTSGRDFMPKAKTNEKSSMHFIENVETNLI